SPGTEYRRDLRERQEYYRRCPRGLRPVFQEWLYLYLHVLNHRRAHEHWLYDCGRSKRPGIYREPRLLERPDRGHPVHPKRFGAHTNQLCFAVELFWAFPPVGGIRTAQPHVGQTLIGKASEALQSLLRFRVCGICSKGCLVLLPGFLSLPILFEDLPQPQMRGTIKWIFARHPPKHGLRQALLSRSLQNVHKFTPGG